MKNQKVRNGLNRLFFSFLTWIAICTGIFTAIAVFPEAPEGETSGGWLGAIFNLQESGTGKLIVGSDKVGIGTTDPTAKLEVVGNVIAENPKASNHLTTREYVDNKVVAEGSSTTISEWRTCYYLDNSSGKLCGAGFVQMPGYHTGFNGVAQNICCSEKTSAPVNGKKMFVTSVGYTGNLGGEKGADAKCQARADVAGLEGTYKAWLLDGTNATNIVDKFEDATYVNMRGEVLFYSFLDYQQRPIAWRNLKAKIYYDEFGALYSSNWSTIPSAWTGLNAWGNIYNSTNCSNFTELSWVGVQWDITADDYRYTIASSGGNCTNIFRLICVET